MEMITAKEVAALIYERKLTSTPEFKNKVVQYCLDCGTGIEYSEYNSDGSCNLTTEKERAEQPFKCIRYVNSETVNWFLDGGMIKKTKYVIEQQDRGKHIDLIDFDEWCALCNIFQCPEMTFEDAGKINGILWNYEISPLEFDKP